MGYHLMKINKGELGKFSKIKEEFEELTDAMIQQSPILIQCELADLIGAIEAYAEKEFNLPLDKIIHFMNATKSAFKEGKR